MTLTTRLSLFFTASTILVLAGFSVSLQLLAHRALHRQADDRLTAAMNTLVAAAEINDKGVEWEPHERDLVLRGRHHDGPFAWLITDPEGRRVDSSPLLAPQFSETAAEMATRGLSRAKVTLQGEPWRLAQRRLDGLGELTVPTRDPRTGDSNSLLSFHPFLTITVGQSLQPVEATLRTLAWILTSLSLGIGLAALASSRWICRRALTPVALMADHARSMNASQIEERLPRIESGDELEDLSRAFNELLDRLQESFERQRRFTGDASHQLRTPLTAMMGQIEVTLRHDRPVEEYRRVLTTLQKQGQHLRQIVESLLFLARSDPEGRLPDREPIDLATWLPEFLQSFSDHPRAADIELERKNGQPAWVECQPALLGELVGNLLDNAFKYSSRGTPIVVRLTRERSTVSIEVQDHGIGIGPVDQANLFHPFFRSAEARKRGVAGLGLGLAIASRLARTFGGTISVVSQAGQGSRFVISLPSVEPAGALISAELGNASIA